LAIGEKTIGKKQLAKNNWQKTIGKKQIAKGNYKL